MKKNLTELVFILDRSGSMGGLEPDTIGYHVVSETVCRMRQAACLASVGAEWKEEIEADFKKRHQG